MVRRMAVVLALAVCLWEMGLPARAAGNGWIRISWKEEFSGTAVMLWRVADEMGGDYRLTEIFGGGVIRRADVNAPELAGWLTETAKSEGQRRILDADGCADFSNLEEGLYLIAAETGDFSSFLVPLPLSGSREVLVDLKTRELVTESPKTGDHPAPIFGAMGLILSGMGLAACAEKLRKR